jgi:SAM-dependent methyltransferase
MSRDIYDHPALYDALFPIGAHLPFYSGVSERSGSVLELACGTGLLTVPLASRGTRVIGLDLSPTMLGAARERASVAKVSVDFVEGDVRTFAFDRRFDTIIVARNSLLHLNTNEDLLAALRGIVRHLAPDGVFAFDIFNPDVRILARPAGTRFPVVEIETDRFGGQVGRARGHAQYLSAGTAAAAGIGRTRAHGAFWRRHTRAVRAKKPPAGVHLPREAGCHELNTRER